VRCTLPRVHDGVQKRGDVFRSAGMCSEARGCVQKHGMCSEARGCVQKHGMSSDARDVFRRAGRVQTHGMCSDARDVFNARDVFRRVPCTLFYGRTGHHLVSLRLP
jgi:hypothetical protein